LQIPLASIFIDTASLPWKTSMPWPKTIQPDPISEALIELRFSSPMSAAVPESVIGKLIDNPDWAGIIPQRLPLAEFPSQMRELDDMMRYQPIVQINDPARRRTIKIGQRVLSYHKMAPYPGWNRFEPELRSAAKYLLTTVQSCSVIRIGMRYVNLLNQDDHGLSAVTDLNYQVSVGGKPLIDPQILTYRRQHGLEHEALVRVSSPNFVAGPASPRFTAYVDVDVSTPPDFATENPETVILWIEKAHQYEKDEFFGLLPQEMIRRLGKQ
jgi:uncharacterized protein (TIGR04255 family)